MVRNYSHYKLQDPKVMSLHFYQLSMNAIIIKMFFDNFSTYPFITVLGSGPHSRIKKGHVVPACLLVVQVLRHCSSKVHWFQAFRFQDAQEFSKLFLSLLEDTLSKQKSNNLQDVIQQQFCGQFSYVTV